MHVGCRCLVSQQRKLKLGEAKGVGKPVSNLGLGLWDARSTLSCMRSAGDREAGEARGLRGRGSSDQVKQEPGLFVTGHVPFAGLSALTHSAATGPFALQFGFHLNDDLLQKGTE